MSTAKYEKHQRSKDPKYVIRNPETGEIILTASSEKQFLQKRKEFLDDKQQNLAIPKNRQ